jgi:hypothetical protein
LVASESLLGSGKEIRKGGEVMAKRKATSKRELQKMYKHAEEIRRAWIRAGEPKEGITYNGVHYTPLQFDKLKSKGAKAGE